MKSAASIRRWMRIGAITGGIAATLFALAVVSFADCSGPHCNRERVTGVLLHLLAGVGAGGAVGLLLALIHSARVRPHDARRDSG
jgi:hypothetical protein